MELDALIKAVEALGFAEAVAIVALLILYRGMGALGGIRSCLDEIHATLRQGSCPYAKESVNEQHHQGHPPVRPVRDLLSDRRTG